MLLRKLMGIFIATLILGSATFAMAGVPDLSLSQATGPADACVLYNLPNADGNSFDEAVAVLGFVVTDATIGLTLIDGLTDPIPNYPFEDLHLESSDVGGLTPCEGGSTADADTDASGYTQWQAPLAAGGATSSVADLTVVMVNGAPLTSNAGLSLAHNSADITADGEVNLADVIEFAGDFYSGGYVFRSDFAFDGILNLADVIVLAQGLGAQCP